MKYRRKNLQLAVNGIAYRFSLPVQKRDEPYNLYAIRGASWYNTSVDYSYTYRNIHFFGEAAMDKNLKPAMIQGLLISADPRVDISLVYRSIHPSYQSVNGNAFTENSMPVNENGFFTGITIRPGNGWRLDLYADIYKFPWLKYQVDAPSYGKEYLFQVIYTPNKQVELSSRFRNEEKQSNVSDANVVMNSPDFISRRNWRVQLNYIINSSLTFRNRVELVWLSNAGNNNEQGFSFFRCNVEAFVKTIRFIITIAVF